jgi:hypothetical protein
MRVAMMDLRWRRGFYHSDGRRHARRAGVPAGSGIVAAMSRRLAPCLASLLLALVVLVTGTRVAAQAPAAPDVVRLRDGGLLRGTIAEYVVGDHATLVLITGETRRIAAADIRYAGPAQEEPPATGTEATSRSVDTTATPVAPATPSTYGEAPPATRADTGAERGTAAVPAVTADPRPATRIRIRSRDGERLHVDAAPSGRELAPLCETPCAPSLATGIYRFAITRPGMPRLEPDHLVPLEEGDRVTVTYDTRGGTRRGGLVLIGITAALGAGIALAPLAIEERARDRAIVPALVAGAALAGLGTLVGLIMHGADDRALVSVTHREDDDEDDEDDDD